MKYDKLYGDLVFVMTPRRLKIIFLLYDAPKTKTQIYEEFPTVNNTVIAALLDDLLSAGYITGGESRGDPFRLSLKGRTVALMLEELAALL